MTEAEIDSKNIELVEFGIQPKTSLGDSIRETRQRWAIDNFTKCSNINLITSLIMNIKTEFAIHNEKSLLICGCQVAKIDSTDISDVNNINEDFVSLWQEIICRNGQLAEEDVDIDYIQTIWIQ